jgi:diguanylate cyclase (GGDEF)-like protein
MFNLLAEGLVIAGVGVLTVALIPVRQLITQLPARQMRSRWYTMTGLIALFIVGYISYVVTFWSRHAAWPDLIVPGVFFFGAGFVWLTATLSLQTATDVRRVMLLERENITDPLIGIYNRRYLDRRLEEECARARRYTLPLSVLLIDIDHFKRINDTYGHQVGDHVLTYLGKLLLQVIRESDIAARYGGEEILIIAPNTTTSTAASLAERLRQHVETHELVLTNESNEPREIRITVSIGVAGLSQEATDSETLVHNTDEALYRAKQEGRNCIVIHGADLTKGHLPPSGPPN